VGVAGCLATPLVALHIHVLYPYTYRNDKPNEGVRKAHEWIARTLVNYLTDSGVHENLSKR
jgi:hypothetical protein